MVIIKYYLLDKSEVIICMEYVWKSSLRIGSMYVSKSYTTTKNTINWLTTYRAWAAVVSTITINIIINPLGALVTNINFFPNNNQLKDNLGGN